MQTYLLPTNIEISLLFILFSTLLLIDEGFQARQYNVGWKKEALEAPQTNISPGKTTLIFMLLGHTRHIEQKIPFGSDYFRSTKNTI